MVVLGLTLSFSVFTVLGSLVLRALPLPQDIIRWAGIVILVLLGIGMIVPRFEGWPERPFARPAPRAPGRDRGGFLLGLALGAVYVPCAGPVLAAIAVGGATGRFGPSTLALTIAFAIGTAVPLLVFALAGRRITDRIRAFRTRQRGIRIAAGVVVVGLAVALSLNVTDAVQRAIPDYTSALNDRVDEAGAVAKQLGGGASGALAKQLGGGGASGALAGCRQRAGEEAPALENCGPAPQLTGLTGWLNTPGNTPITPAALSGKVVLVDFGAYSCINCQRAIPHVNAWSNAYAADGLEVIGVHTPEYAFEHVAADAERLAIGYPIALDNDYQTWDRVPQRLVAGRLPDRRDRPDPLRRRRRGRVPADRGADPRHAAAARHGHLHHAARSGRGLVRPVRHVDGHRRVDHREEERGDHTQLQRRRHLPGPERSRLGHGHRAGHDPHVRRRRRPEQLHRPAPRRPRRRHAEGDAVTGPERLLIRLRVTGR